jgi:glycosyltransferase involved in cell wall biosynthesis
MLKISVLTVSYNAEKYLEATIQSVLSQSYPHIEYIIIDGNSSDNTVSIIKKYEDKITRWVSEKDQGMFDALNKGIAMATGDVIGMLHTDDFYPNSNVLKQVADAFNQSGADVVYGDLQYVHPIDTDKVYRNWKGKSFFKNRFLWGWMPAHTTFYIKKNIINQFGEYKLNFKTAADYEFMLRYLYKHNVKAFYLPNLLVKMRTGGMSNSNMKNRMAANRNDRLAMKANGIPFPFIVSLLKPLSKLHQYLFK